MIMKQKSICC